MDDNHRSLIQSNYASLVEQTDLELMVNALYEKGVFSEHMIERYKDPRFDARHRKRQLYVDVMTRGPSAFQHLIDALTEMGNWNLARDLDPNSHLHFAIENRRSQQNDNFISIQGTKKKKNTTGPENSKDEPRTPLKPVEQENDVLNFIPKFHIQKCTKFFEDDDCEKGIKVYRTRGRQRGVLMMFNYTKFLNDVEEARPGVELDEVNLKYLFNELGFKVLVYTNLTKDRTVSTLKSLNEVLAGAECVFIVVSSHGYGRAGSSDNDFRCYDGKLLASLDFLEYFNNLNLHVLKGVPKVFIFQICRGSKVEWQQETTLSGARADVSVYSGESPSRAPARMLSDETRKRVYSDILIAHSTLPGVVSYRDPMHGSWYIQTLCEVFAAHAHDTHVEELFTLVDQQLAERHRIQTSSVDRWGFNCRLYLHPGLYE